MRARRSPRAARSTSATPAARTGCRTSPGSPGTRRRPRSRTPASSRRSAREQTDQADPGTVVSQSPGRRRGPPARVHGDLHRRRGAARRRHRDPDTDTDRRHRRTPAQPSIVGGALRRCGPPARGPRPAPPPPGRRTRPASWRAAGGRPRSAPTPGGTARPRAARSRWRSAITTPPSVRPVTSSSAGSESGSHGQRVVAGRGERGWAARRARPRPRAAPRWSCRAAAPAPARPTAP